VLNVHSPQFGFDFAELFIFSIAGFSHALRYQLQMITIHFLDINLKLAESWRLDKAFFAHQS
jgi:hypothetical protein